MTSLTTQYSLWFVPICLIGGFLYAWILYRKETKFNEISRILKILMFALRFLSVSIIAFLLLSPIIKNFGKTIEKPIIIFAQDNSESVLPDKDKIEKYYGQPENFFKGNSKYHFKTFAFGEKVNETDTFNFKDKETDIAQVLSDVKNRFYNQNIGAVILASDGIYNKGNNPDYEIQTVNFPIYPIALGDTNIRKDLILNDVKYNKTAFLNSKFPLRLKIKANKLKGKTSDLKIFDNKKLVYSQLININTNDFYKSFDLKLKTKKVGFHKFKIVLSGIPDEINIENNSKQIIIEVSDKKQKILILSDAPHPDIAAIKEALKLNQNFETDYYSVNTFNKSIKAYNLIILNQLPSEFNAGTAVLKQIMNSDIPVIYMLGGRSSLEKFDRLNTGLTTGAYSNAPDEVTGKLNKNFSLFDINPEIESITQHAPPLISAFGDYKLTVPNQILFYRQIKTINTQLPLIVFNNGGVGKKSAIITGEGIWRWRIFDYKINRNHYLFNELINSIVQYLISTENKSQFKLIAEKIISENQEIIIKAETYDKNFQLTDVKEINFRLTDTLKNTTNYKFEKSGKSYKLNLHKLSPGDYTWKAETIIKGKKFKTNGLFSVVPVHTEAFITKANHKILYELAKHSGGTLFTPEQADKLIQIIKTNDNIKAVSYSEKKTEALINFKLLFFVILILLTAEWFMRKYFGGY